MAKVGILGSQNQVSLFPTATSSRLNKSVQGSTHGDAHTHIGYRAQACAHRAAWAPSVDLCACSVLQKIQSEFAVHLVNACWSLARARRHHFSSDLYDFVIA